jgi:hypothetical protein
LNAKCGIIPNRICSILPKILVIVECLRGVKDSAVRGLVCKLQRDSFAFPDLISQVDLCIIDAHPRTLGRAIGKEVTWLIIFL